jgi:hypothetical protein
MTWVACARAARQVRSRFGSVANSILRIGETPVTVVSNTMPGVTRQFPSLTAALEEVKSARVFAGVHFRTACNDGQGLGIGVADYILANSLLPINDNDNEEGEESGLE